MKGLPLAYNRDLQEDKVPLFDSVDTVSACLGLAAPMVRDAELNRDHIVSGLDRGYLDATTLMEFMIQHGVPQRSAHHLVGDLVGKAIQQQVPLAKLDPQEFRDAHEVLDERVFEVIGVENAIQAFRSYGSTAPSEVASQVAAWQKKLDL